VIETSQNGMRERDFWDGKRTVVSGDAKAPRAFVTPQGNLRFENSEIVTATRESLPPGENRKPLGNRETKISNRKSKNSNRESPRGIAKAPGESRKQNFESQIPLGSHERRSGLPIALRLR
jgi:hypothetical protein